jgi:GIY-YIG catalytic domain-containing protein
VRIFDRKFGADFLAGVPREPGIYRMYDAVGALIYVGKARNLRRRLAQYRTTRRTKKDRKRRALVRLAERIEWQVCASELEASLTEIGLIQALRPRRNVAGAFPFLYPFIGIQIDGADTRFCLTTSPQAFAGFELHGAFRSREITGEAFFALMRLLRFVGHPTVRRRRDRFSVPRHSSVYVFRRLPRDWPELWTALLRGASRVALEQLSLRLLEYDGACARSAVIHADLSAVDRFFDDEALALAKAITATGYVGYPVPQRDRDALFLRYRDLHAATMHGAAAGRLIALTRSANLPSITASFRPATSRSREARRPPSRRLRPLSLHDHPP